MDLFIVMCGAMGNCWFFVFCSIFLMGHAPKPLKIVTSFTILQNWVQEIGGDLCIVDTIVGPDEDPHIFDPTPGDSEKIVTADLVFMMGLGLEGWMPRLLTDKQSQKRLYIVSDGIQARRMPSAGRGGQNLITDPHIWTDPHMVKKVVTKIGLALVAADPIHKNKYNKRITDYVKKLDALDVWIKKQINTLTPSQRIVVTAHDAFGYFGDRYGVRFLSPQGLSTESEPSARELAGILKEMRQLGLKSLFLENMTNPKLVSQIAEELGIKTMGTLYADALSPQSGPAPTYERFMVHNVNELVKGMSKNTAF